MKINPSVPKGMRDSFSTMYQKRQYIVNTIQHVYELFGFDPIETPTMEKLEVLTGKYGAEGDKLLFKVLNSGDFLAKADQSVLDSKESHKLTATISKKGLRYDLTVPFARFVAQHRNELAFPYKRYQIQPVWRADRPQKGRYQEFVQCDADVIGTDSLIAESEFLQIYDAVFRHLKLHQSIVKINNRKILQGLAEHINASDQFMELTIAIDKLDKIGEDGVRQELLRKGFTNEQANQVIELLSIQKKEQDVLTVLKEKLNGSELAQKGIREIEEIFANLEGLAINKERIKVDITLARGLTYYTGAIFEAVVPNSDIGSISGGGRYDNLTEIFGVKDVSGVGISFGLDRIYDVIEDLDLWPEALKVKRSPTQVLVTYMSEDLKDKVVDFAEKLRFNGITTEMYLEPVKLGKQFKYANDKGIPHVVIIGQDEIERGEYQVKFMKSGNQQSMPPAYIINALKPRR